MEARGFACGSFCEVNGSSSTFENTNVASIYEPRHGTEVQKSLIFLEAKGIGGNKGRNERIIERRATAKSKFLRKSSFCKRLFM